MVVVRVVWTAALVLMLSGCRPEPHQPIVISGATLVDGTVHPPQRNMTVVVRRFKVVTIAPDTEVVPPDGTQRIDAHGDFLLPLDPQKPIALGETADLLLTPANPALDPEYAKHSRARLEGGIWTQRPR